MTKRREIRDTENASGALFEVAMELRALAYLFETQGSKANEMAAEDMDAISHGVGQILRRLALQVRRIGQEIDERGSPPVRR